MRKVLPLVTAMAMSIGVAGCNTSTVTENDDVDQTPISSGVVGDGGTAIDAVRVIYDPATNNAAGLPNIPLITDLLLQGLAGTDGDCDSDGNCLDGTIPFPGGDVALGGEGYNPIFSAVGDLDGFSTAAALDIPFNSLVDNDSIVTTIGPTTNVLLIPLVYDNDPIVGDGPGSGIPPQLNAVNPFGTPVDIDAQIISYSDIGQSVTNTLRIVPKSPLDSATRYLIVVTDGLKGANGNGVKSSSTFSFFATAEQSLSDPAQESLRGAIQQWVDLALGITKAFGQSNSVSNIAYATTFTTSGTTQVLQGMAAPAAALENSLIAQVISSDSRLIVETGLNNGDEDTTIVGAVCANDAVNDDPEVDCSSADGQAAVGGQVALAKHLPQVAPRITSFTRSTSIPASQTTTVEMADGNILLPYYLTAPDTSNGGQNLPATGIFTIASIWQADDTLGEDLSALLSAAQIPASAVTPPSTNVTRYFPLAKTGGHTTTENRGTVSAPISVYYDASDVCNDGFKPIVYLHGITSNRFAAVPFTSALIASNIDCYAVIAIDQPLHGLDGEDDTTLVALYGPSAAAQLPPGATQEQIAALAVSLGLLDQRHFALTQGDSGLPRGMSVTADDDPSVVDTDNNGIVDAASGSLFINLLNFQGSRDNIRQSIMDQLNLNATLPHINFVQRANEITDGPDIDMSEGVSFVGHSLGAIVGTSYLSLANSLPVANQYLTPVTAGVAANGSGQITKLLENSIAFNETVLGGFAGIGAAGGLDLGEGSSLLELTQHIFQATIDSADPINFGKLLQASAAGTGVLMYEVRGNLAAGGQNPPDLVVPAAAFAEFGVPPRVLLDNALANDLSNDELADTGASPLTGTTPLAASAALVDQSASISGGTAKLRALVRMTAGSHSSFGTPGSVGDSDPIDDDATVFNELMGQVISFITSGGTNLTITDDTLVQQVAE